MNPNAPGETANIPLLPKGSRALILRGRCQNSKLLSPTFLCIKENGPTFRGAAWLGKAKTKSPWVPCSVLESPWGRSFRFRWQPRLQSLRAGSSDPCRGFPAAAGRTAAPRPPGRARGEKGAAPRSARPRLLPVACPRLGVGVW